MTIVQDSISHLGAWVQGQGAPSFAYIRDEIAALDDLAGEVQTQIAVLNAASPADAAAEHAAIAAATAALQAELDLINAVPAPSL